MQSLDVIDLNLSQPQITAQLTDSLQQIGFAALTNHGIARQLVEDIRQELESLFERSEEEKYSLKVEANNYRGYIPLAFFTPNAKKGSADQYEAYKLHWPCAENNPIRGECDLYGPNKWPNNSTTLQSLISTYWQHCERISKYLLDTLSDPLGISNDFFNDVMQQPLSNMTLLHYPPSEMSENQPSTPHPNRTVSKHTLPLQYGIHPHKDTDVLTLLNPDPTGGLFIKQRDNKEWIEAPNDPSLLIINVGDMLESWSGGRLISTPHMVVNNSTSHRYSFPFFAVPRYDVPIKPIVGTQAILETDHSKLLRGRAGEISAQIWRSNWPDADAVGTDLDPFIQD